MGIIDICGVRGDATLCVVIFNSKGWLFFANANSKSLTETCNSIG